MKYIYLLSISLVLTSCAPGAVVSCASAFSYHAQESERLSGKGERELMERIKREFRKEA